MNATEALQALKDIKDQQTKVFGEISGKLGQLTTRIGDLEKQIAEGALPEELATTITDIKSITQQTDDLIPDTAETTTATQ